MSESQNSKQKALLERWSKLKKKPAANSKAIPKRSPDSPIPLSYGQQRLFFLQQVYPGNPFYHYAELYLLEGPLKLTALEKAFSLLVRQQESLRTSFVNSEDGPIQIIQEPTTVSFQKYNLEEVDLALDKEQIYALALQEAQQPFDLENGPLFRIHVYRLKEHVHYLLITMHHIITDKWSMQVLREELASYYQNILDQKENDPSSLKVQYADFSTWQRALPINNQSFSYWKKKLKGLPPNLELPTDFERPLEPTFNGAYYSEDLSSKLSQALRVLAKEQQTTLFVLLLAAFKVLLYRYSGQHDIVVGTPFTNRDQLVLEKIIGFFNETLVLRSNLAGDSGFLQHLNHVKSTVLEGFSNKDVPFEYLVQELNPDRNLRSNPLFQVMFLFHSVPASPPFGSELKIRHAPFDLGVSKFDLTLYIAEDGEDLSAIFEYSKDLFQESSIRRFMTHLITLLGSITAEPNQHISKLPIIPADEEKTILQAWNQTQKLLDEPYVIHSKIEEQVRLYPQEIAVVAQGQQLRYAELDKRASALSRSIRQELGNQKTRIGLFTERSLDMIVGIFAILKSGNAYIPLDPEYPTERITLMVDDAQMGLVLTQAHLEERLPPTLSRKMFIEDGIIGGSSLAALEPPVIQADDLAYMIYTSGSTGKPKGVAVSHSNIFHSTLARSGFYECSPSSFLLLSSFAFDSSMVGIFWTLCTGGKLVIPARRIEQDLPALTEQINNHEVSHILLLPSLYTILLQFINPSSLQSLDSIIVAGEACTGSLCARHFEVLPQVKLYNEYGPTEATVWCSAYQLKQTDSHQIIPIGRPIQNSQLYILDEHKKPVPIGVPGQLYVGGKGITKGYWNRPELTKERFTSNPFEVAPENYLYRTGDLAKFRSDGNIDFLGRADHQVKIRGYRIELEEIEEAIRVIPAIDEVVVQVHPQKNQQLVAYISVRAPLEVEQIQQKLKRELPAYMVPQAWVILNAFDRLPNGKIDKNNLPLPTDPMSPKGTTYIEPQNQVEKDLLTIWKQVLQRTELSTADNFFDVGGDSILSIQIIAKARQKGYLISPNQIFDFQTIQALAPVVQTLESQQVVQETVTGVLPLNPIQHWFFETQTTGLNHWNQALAIPLSSTLSPSFVLPLLKYLLHRHDALRSTFRKNKGEWKAVVSASWPEASFQVIKPIGETVDEQEQHILRHIAEVHASMDLENGPLFKALYFKCDPLRKDILYLLAHHLVIDWVSWQILYEEFRVLMEQQLNGSALSLPLKTTSIRSWSAFLEDWIESDAVSSQLPFWENQIQPAFPFPSNTSNQTYAEGGTQTIHRHFSNNLTNVLVNDAIKAFQTKVDELLIVALLHSSFVCFKQNKLTIGLEKHGRDQWPSPIDLSNTVGWFTSFFPLNFSWEEGRDIGENIKWVKEKMRTVPQNGLGFSLLRFMSKIEEVRSKLQFNAPLIFNFLGHSKSVKGTHLGAPKLVHEGARSAHAARLHRLEINAHIKNDQLHMAWTYSPDAIESALLISFIDQFEQSLDHVISYCTSEEVGGYTPSDFPDADLSQEDLDALLGGLDLEI